MDQNQVSLCILFEETQCPAWYEKLSTVVKTHLNYIIGDSKHRYTGLERKLVAVTGLERNHVRDLMIWKFGVSILIDFKTSFFIRNNLWLTKKIFMQT